MFGVIDPYASRFRVVDTVDINIEPAQLNGKCITDRVEGQRGQITRFRSEYCERYAYVRFSTAVGGFECAGKLLYESGLSGGSETQHDFSESSNDFFHKRLQVINFHFNVTEYSISMNLH